MPLAFSLIQYSVCTLWTLLSKVARFPHLPTLSDTCFSALDLYTSVSTLHEWSSHEDVSDRLSNPRSISTTPLGSSPSPTEDQMPRRVPPEQTPSQRTSMSSAGRYSSSSSCPSFGGASGKRRPRAAKRSEAGDLALSTNETLLRDDSSSLISWTTSSTAHTVSELDQDLSPIQGVVQLLPNGDTIEATTLPPPIFTCRFWFLRCPYRSTNEAEWKEHNLAHFHGYVPPLSNTCPLCDMTFNIPDPNVSWAANMSHLAQHFKIGDTMASAAPEYALVRHLWSKRIICDADYQELMAYRRRHGDIPFKVLEGRDHREKRGYYAPQSRM